MNCPAGDFGLDKAAAQLAPQPFAVLKQRKNVLHLLVECRTFLCLSVFVNESLCAEVALTVCHHFFVELEDGVKNG